ncbi:glutathione S-transferase family protein [Gallaecimonas sp. GXIMD4217]|uniref:glutathione S-transferase family protein n=1 Tax=Gallaecimonas sp. GXIMD4217 TaxID=3131927 RepID=UPI00311AEE58
MGLLVKGHWHDEWYDTDSTGGDFQREAARVRNWITPDGSPGPSGEGGFKAEADRYHLYVSLACPWAHRTLIFRQLKGLDRLVSVSVVSYLMAEQGWSFDRKAGSSGDRLYQSHFLHELYTKHREDYSGRVTVPVLWDRELHCIVSNESSEIIRMFNSAFDHLTGNELDFYPQALRADIDAVNAEVYEHVNNGVYRAGFATAQSAYDAAFERLFATLDGLEERLSRSRYLLGERLTEADWRLFTTLIRFDPVYHGHFKCNRQRLCEYRHLWGFVKELYQMPGISDTVDFEHIKRHYYQSHRAINPTGIVPGGPRLDLDGPHHRLTAG